MPRPRFRSLSKQLLDHGVAPKFAVRISAELEDHYTDLKREMLAADRSPREAAAEARERLGDEAAIAREFCKRPELRSWVYRSAWILRGVSLVTGLVVIVLTPIHALIVHGAALARYCAAGGAAAVVTLALLFSMHAAIRYEPRGALDPRPMQIAIEPQPEVPTEQLADTGRHKPTRPPAVGRRPERMRRQELVALAEQSASEVSPIVLPNLPPVRFAMADGDYLPVVKVAPAYPPVAASRGLEGYVVVEFTVTRAGTVRDVVVVESSSTLFHKAAIDATHKFKYKPRVVQGRPVDVLGVRNKITFVLEV